MKFRRTLIAAIAVALAFAGSVGPRHARAAAQGHDQAAVTSHTHEHSASAKQSHAHDHQAASDSQFGENGTHDHAGSQPATDQGCCVAWCSSAAIVEANHGFVIPATASEFVSFVQPSLVTASLSADDPPPR